MVANVPFVVGREEDALELVTGACPIMVYVLTYSWLRRAEAHVSA
jgi:hypothetical protein